MPSRRSGDAASATATLTAVAAQRHTTISARETERPAIQHNKTNQMLQLLAMALTWETRLMPTHPAIRA